MSPMSPIDAVPYEVAPFLVAGAVGAVIALLVGFGMALDADRIAVRVLGTLALVVVGGGVGAVVVGWPVAGMLRGDATADLAREQFADAFGATIMRTEVVEDRFLFGQETTSTLPDLPRKVGDSVDATLWVDDAATECTVYLVTDGYQVRCAPEPGAAKTDVLEPVDAR